ncbi:endoglucanase F-like, partial [Saccoglossus kowalevskii]|uniref:cellulase n=1 Tax=Saccoglossus kowalevskii TaxID=10224 RepID=A0ABM0GPQ4_SACKO
MEVTIKCMQFTCFVLLVLHLQGNLATPSKGIYDYNDVLHKSNLFYEAQRSGYISEATNRIPYRASSALGDQGYFGENLTGGWYDGLNHVKHGLPMAASVTNLAWGMIRYKEAYIDAGEWEYALENIKWATDYFIRCHSDTETYYYQVGSTDLESSYWGRPEDMTMDRPPAMVNASFPGSDVTGETAAAMAASSILFQQSDPTYSTTLLQHARELFTFANTYRGLYPGQVYSSSDYGDELGLAACWLYYATNNISYIQTAEALYDEFNLGTPSWAYSVKNKNPAVQILLYEYNQDQRYQTAITTYMNRWLPGGNVPRTPKGLAYRNKWGTLRYAANTAFLALVAADLGINPVAHRDFAKTQIRYMLGDSGRSYVVGYGVNPPERPKHKASACPDMPNTCDQSTFLSPDPNPQILYGALVGGPDANDNWVDDRSDSKTNKVTCDFNAGFQSAVAGLKYLELTGGYDYIEVIHQSIRFYEAQRSGDLPEATNRIPYRSDSALGDQGFYGEDLTGGWYDSGDHVKFGQPMAASLTNLAWGMILFEDAYRAANAWDFALEGIRWVSDYFVKCHVAPESFYYQ